MRILNFLFGRLYLLVACKRSKKAQEDSRKEGDHNEIRRSKTAEPVLGTAAERG